MPPTIISMPTIVYEDKDLIVVNKPTNLLCVPGLSHPDNLLDILRARYPNVRLVHRLDMHTSGIVIFALNHPAQKHLSKQFEERKVGKQYVARVLGELKAQQGEIAMPLICDWPNRPKQKVDWLNGKKAHTRFEVLNRAHNINETRVHLHPVTGRSHQLRVHCLAIGHPIAGDALYAPESNAPRLMLHAEHIEFSQPSTGKKLELHCPAPF